MNILNSSIGRKYVMGITGQLLCGFLVMHLAGNLSLFAGQEAFDGYAKMLHDTGVLLYIAEVGLIGVFFLHILTAIKLALGNRAARPVRYAVDKSGGKTKWASSTMVLSGIIVLTFLVVHVSQFKFGVFEDVKSESLYLRVSDAFLNPYWVTFYVVAIGTLSMHLSHGFQSAFQSLGFNHPRYTPMVKSLGLLYAVVVGVGYTVIPLWMHFFKGGNV